MDFNDESYVRVYVRDTKTWLRLGFEGQCVLLFLLRKLDRAGVLDGMDDPVSDLSLITGVPLDVVRVGLARLLASGAVELVNARLVLPNYIEAQTCARSDKARQRDTRNKRLAESRFVTIRDQTSQPVTGQPSATESVTLCCAVPSLALLSKEIPLPPLGEPAPVTDPDGFEVRAEPVAFKNLNGWHPSEAIVAGALMAGLTRERFDARLLELRSGPIGGTRGVFDRDDYVRRQFPKWRAWDEGEREKARQATQLPRGGSFGRAPVLALEPSAKHVQYAKAHGVDLSHIVRAMVEEGIVDSLGLGRAKEILGDRLGRAAREQKQKRAHPP